MKRILLLMTMCLLLCAAAGARRTPGDKAGVTFDNMIYDFGTVKQTDDKVTHKFVMTVTGDQPVAIISATANCGCTTPKYDRKPVKPGTTSDITVSFIPKGQRGEIDKTVRVRLKNGAGKSETVNLRITGVVVP